MDLGIRGKTALVCGASKGLGRACATALAREGCKLTIVARDRDALNKTAEEIRAQTGAEVRAVATDITTVAGRAEALEAIPQPDILITNAGGPPTGDFRSFDRDAWIKAIDANMLTPIELIKATVDGMISRRFGRIVNITSGAVRAPTATLTLSNGARSGLTGYVAGAARSVAQHNVTINNLLPGFYVTERTQVTISATAQRTGKSFDETMAMRLAGIPAGRGGDMEGFGDTCAFLCSAQASYIVGQNILLDGGAFPGTF
jgi:3-oxoacyl-[acyl-carrier protein] reductase